jgi:hypothetical protein
MSASGTERRSRNVRSYVSTAGEETRWNSREIL